MMPMRVALIPGASTAGEDPTDSYTIPSLWDKEATEKRTKHPKVPIFLQISYTF